MVVENDVIPGTHADIGEVYVPLIRKLTGEGEFELQGSSVNKLSGVRLKTLVRAVCEYSLPGSEDKKSVAFLFKYRAPVDESVPPLLRRDSNGREREYRDYSLLQGIESVPKAYLIEDILRETRSREEVERIMRKLRVFSHSIIIDFLGDETLDDRTRAETEDKKARKQEIENAFDSIIEFQTEATKRSTSWKVAENGLGGLFNERTMEERVLDYIRAMHGYDELRQLPSNLQRRVRRDYRPTVEVYDRGLQTPMVCHGDLSAKNIIIGSNGQYYLIDPQLKWRDPIIDLFAMLSSPGVRLDTEDWEELTKEFRLKEIERIATPKMEGVLAAVAKGLMRVKASHGLEEEFEKTTVRSLYDMMLHYSLRNSAIIAELERLFPGTYRGKSLEDLAEMRHNVETSLDRLVDDRERLGVSEQDAALYEDFRDLLCEIEEQVSRPYISSELPEHTPIPQQGQGQKTHI